MNQGKLNVVKQEIVTVNINIFRISELKWMGMGECNSEDHYTYYCGQTSLRRNEVALIVNKRVWSAALGCSLKNNRMILVYFQSKPFNNTVIQVYAPTTDAKEAKVDQFYEDLQHFLEITLWVIWKKEFTTEVRSDKTVRMDAEIYIIQPR